MNIGIPVEFYEPSKPNDVLEGRLYIDENGRDYLDFVGGLKYAFVTMPIVYATSLDSDEKYTLINCFFRKSTLSMVRCAVSELFKGAFLPKVTDKEYLQANMRMTGLTDWINQSRIRPQYSSSTKEESKVVIKEFFQKNFSIRPNIELEMLEFCGEQYSRSEVILRDASEIRIVSNNPVSRLELYLDAVAFLKLLSLFTERLPKLTQLEFVNKEGKTIEHLTTKRQKVSGGNDALLSYDHLENHWSQVLELFYASRNKFVRVLDLLNESISNHTAEISFLNLTTACEVFHKYFHETGNSDLRALLAEELYNAGIVENKPNKWDQVIRYFHLFKLCDDISYLKQSFPDVLTIVALMRGSRNYYTHYSPTKKQIWTPNQLVKINRGLRQLIKAVILKQLRIPDDLINKLLFSHADVIFYDYENNEYSLYHVPSSPNEL